MNELTVNKHLKDAQQLTFLQCTHYDHSFQEFKDDDKKRFEELAGVNWMYILNKDEEAYNDLIKRLTMKKLIIITLTIIFSNASLSLAGQFKYKWGVVIGVNPVNVISNYQEPYKRVVCEKFRHKNPNNFANMAVGGLIGSVIGNKLIFRNDAFYEWMSTVFNCKVGSFRDFWF